MKKEKFNLYVADGAYFANNHPSVCLDGWLPLKSKALSRECLCREPLHTLDENKVQIENGYKVVSNIEKEILPILSSALNKIHRVNHSERFWMILIGHWLRRSITFFYKHYVSVNSIFEAYDIQSVSLINVNRDQLIVDDYASFVRILDKDHYNSYIVEKILFYMGHNDLVIKNINFQVTDNNKHHKDKILSYGPKKILQKLSHFFLRIDNNNSPVITQTYLSPINEGILQIMFFSFPKFFYNSNYHKNGVDGSFRNQLKGELLGYKENVDHNLFKSILIDLIPNLIPKAYLEDFQSLLSASNKLKLPKYPRFILTANRFLLDEVFKLWVSIKTEEGFPYFVLQHGSNYGEIKYLHPTVEEITSDKFFTWGWSYDDKHIKGFVFNKKYKYLRHNKTNPINKSSYLLFMEKGVYSRVMLENGSLLYKKYLDSKQEFFNGVMADVRDRLMIRLHAVSHNDKTYREIERWQELSSSIKIDNPKRSLKKSVSMSRLVVCFYQGTAFLEMIAANIPVVCYMDGLNVLKKEGEEVYQILIDAGICHKTIGSLVNAVNSHWDECNSWWYGEEVQNARTIFCNRHLRISNKTTLELKRLIVDNLH